MQTLSFSQRVRLRFLSSWKFFLAVLLPFVLLPLVFIDESGTVPGTDRASTKFRTLYAVIIMAVYWALELLPLPVTALIPLVLFPTLGVQTAYTVSQNYAKESNMIFLGGVIVALGVEYCGLHNRIALRVMSVVGASPVQLLFGVMVIVALLSMWVSATSCVAILVPVVCAIIDEIHESPEIFSNEEVRRLSMASGPANQVPQITLSPTGNLTLYPNLEPSHQGHDNHHNHDLHPTNPYARRKSTVFGNVSLTSDVHHHRQGQGQGRRDSESQRSDVTGTGRHERRRFSHGEQSSVHSGHLPNIHVVFENDEELEQDVDDLERKATLKEKREKEEKEKEQKRNEIKKMFLFGMAYAANIGGTSVITGTSPNKVFKEVIKTFDNVGSGMHMKMTFLTWMLLNVPMMLLNILIAWLYLSIKYYGLPTRKNWPFLHRLFCRKTKEPEEELYTWRTREVALFLRREYQKLGRISYHEVSVLLVFILVVILWVFREPEVVEGWGELNTKMKTGDSTGAMLGVLLLFILPRNWNFLVGKDKEKATYEALLDWKFVTTKMPWGVLLLLGSGFAIADASVYSGLSDFIGEELELLGDIPDPVVLLIVIVLTSILTEVVSNVACANILLPVVASVSKSLELHPLYLTVPVAVTCQYAFLFPIATPSNTLVFAAGNFTTMEMFKTGLYLNLICVAVLYLNTVTYGDWLFRYSKYQYFSPNETAFPSTDAY